VKKIILYLIFLQFFANACVFAQSSGNIVVIISPGLPAVESLINEMHPDSRIVFFNAAESPLQHITSAIRENAPVGSLHILTEASPGILLFPQYKITTDTLWKHEQMIASWKQHFALRGDILFYGCELARGDEGLAFVQNVAVVTGLDVAASEDLTGSALENGDWSLEVRSGSIESRLVVSRDISQTYPTILRVPSKPSRRNKRTHDTRDRIVPSAALAGRVNP
jgi:hypothetical protein